MNSRYEALRIELHSIGILDALTEHPGLTQKQLAELLGAKEKDIIGVMYALSRGGAIYQVEGRYALDPKEKAH